MVRFVSSFLVALGLEPLERAVGRLTLEVFGAFSMRVCQGLGVKENEQ
jgi:hypothetical protein